MDEKAGAVAYDRSGNGRNGAYVNAPTIDVALGPFRGVQMDQPTSKIMQVPHDVALGPANISFELWMRSTSFGAGASATVMGKAAEWALHYESSQISMYDWQTDTWRRSGLSATILDGNLHHLVVTRSAGVTNGTLFYLDGTLVWTTTHGEHATVSDRMVAVSSEMGSGGTINNVATQVAAHFAVYNGILASGRIKSHYAAGLRTGSVMG